MHHYIGKKRPHLTNFIHVLLKYGPNLVKKLPQLIKSPHFTQIIVHKSKSRTNYVQFTPIKVEVRPVYRNIHKSRRNTKFLIVLSINPGRNTNFQTIIHKSDEQSSFLLPIRKNWVNLGKYLLANGKIQVNVGKNK